MDYTKPYGTPNQPGQGGATPGASSSSSVANAAMQKPTTPKSDPWGAIQASAQSWAQRKKPPITRPTATPPTQTPPANGGGYDGSGINPGAPGGPPKPSPYPPGAVPVGVGGPPMGMPPVPPQMGAPGSPNPFEAFFEQMRPTPANGADPQMQYMIGTVKPDGTVGGVPLGWTPDGATDKRARMPASNTGSNAGKFAPQGANGVGAPPVPPASNRTLGGSLPPMDTNYFASAAKDENTAGGGTGTGGSGGSGAGQTATNQSTNAPTTPPPAPPAGGGGGAAGTPPKMDQWLIDESNRLSKTPGFEFLKSGPGQQIYAMYAAEQQRNGTVGKGMTFAEWAAHNWEEAAGKVGMSPEDQKNFGSFVRNTGYQQQATRMVDEYHKNGGKGDTSWVNGDKIRQYEEWARGNPTANLDFWTWAGTINQGKNPWDNGKPLTPPPPTQDPKDKLPDWWKDAFPDGVPPSMYGTGNHSGGGAGGGPGGGSGTGVSPTPPGTTNGKTTTTAGGGVEGDPNSVYLKKLEDAMKERQKYVMSEADRSFQAQAALKGLGNTGAFGDAYGRFMNDASSNFNEQLAKPVFDAYENEQTRRNQAAMSRYQSDSSLTGTKYGADKGLEGSLANAAAAQAGAGASAAASQYNAMLDYNLGLQNLGLEASNSDWQRQKWMMEMLASLGPEQMLQQMFGSGNQYLPGFAWQPGR